MADWGPVLVGVILFVLLSPGLLIQFPGNCRTIDFGNLETSGRSILMHTIIFFGLFALFTVVIGV
uniref:Transmembrane protein n=1 Tax=Picea sitchensis TaxID=3332 RepID=A9NSC9_PICSI|nr:unknown [Picea sitchensis]